MKNSRIILFIFAIFLAKICFAYDSTASSIILDKEKMTVKDNCDMKIGLVLSGGGAKGLAHIGVLKVLDREGIKTDIISGTSMGGVVGALYALGYTGLEIEKIAKAIDWEDVFDDSYSRVYIPMEEKELYDRYVGSLPISDTGVVIPKGLIIGQKLELLLSRLTLRAHDIEDFSKFPKPFVCVATDIATGEAVPIRGGFLTDALRASMSIPTLLTPISTKNKLLIDGFLGRNLPVIEAKELGAEKIIAVDVGAPLASANKISSLFDIMNQVVTLRGYEVVVEQRKKADLVVVPEVEDISSTEFSRVEELIKRGETAAEKMVSELKKICGTNIKDSEESVNASEKSLKIQKYIIKNTKFEGLKEVSKVMVESLLGIENGKEVTIDEIEKKIEKVYSSKFFEKVNYRLQKENVGYVLTVIFIERNVNSFNFGFNFNTEQKANILLNSVFNNVLNKGSRLSLDARLGENPEFTVAYSLYPGNNSGLGLKMAVNYIEKQVYEYDEERKTASFRYRAANFDLFFGNLYSNNFMAGIGISDEYSNLTPDISKEKYDEFKNNNLVLYLLGKLDTLNNRYFPTEGVQLNIKSICSDKRLTNNSDYIYTKFLYRRVVKFNEDYSFDSTINLGNIEGEDIPPSKYFYLGGINNDSELIPFYGLDLLEKSNKNNIVLRTGVQYRIMKNRYVKLEVNIGKVSSTWKNLFNRDNVFSGSKLTFGAMTPIGPFEIALIGNDKNDIGGYLNIGTNF